MSEIVRAASAARAELRLGLRERLGELGGGLRVLAEGMVGEFSTIDLVAVDAAGQLTLLLIGEEGEDLELLTRALALRRWVQVRVPDWLQLAPDLEIKPDAQARAILICPSFHPETVAAADSLGNGVCDLVLYRHIRDGEQKLLWTESLPTPAERRAPRPVARVAEPASFRSGLTDADLNLSPRERREFE